MTVAQSAADTVSIVRQRACGRSHALLLRWAMVIEGLANGRLVTDAGGRVVGATPADETALKNAIAGYFSCAMKQPFAARSAPGEMITTHAIETAGGLVELVVVSGPTGGGQQGVMVMDRQGQHAFWAAGAAAFGGGPDPEVRRPVPPMRAPRLPVPSSDVQRHDPLPRLLDRESLLARMRPALIGTARMGGEAAVLLIHLHQLSDINESYGLSAGDQFLAATAQRLVDICEIDDALARFGDAEFVIFRDRAAAAEADALAERAEVVLRDFFDVGGHRLCASVSMGMAALSPHDGDPDVLLLAARSAMHSAQQHGRVRSNVFVPQPRANPAAHLELAVDLHEALAVGGLEMRYRPIIELANGRLIGVDAAMCWQHAVRGWVPPELFLPLVEKNGLTASLDSWALEQSCRDASVMRRQGVLAPWASVSVAISAQTATDPHLVNIVQQAADQARISVETLTLKLTATRLLADSAAGYPGLEMLRSLGVGITMDRFGTGHSSLSQLRQLPLTGITIDPSFIRHLTELAEDYSIVSSVADLALACGLRMSAAGVETAEQLTLLDRIGCTAGQGSVWSEPLTLSEFLSLAKKHKADGFKAANVKYTPPPLERRTTPRATNEQGLHRLQQLHRELASPTTIAAALNSEGYRTTAGMRWHSKSVSAILADLDRARRRRDA